MIQVLKWNFHVADVEPLLFTIRNIQADISVLSI